MREALFYVKDGRGIRCELCPHRCAIAEGKQGICMVRGVRGGKLMALGYGKVSSSHLDPIEKKPLYHFQPGSMIYSIGGWGCSLSCKFCQNWTISQQFIEESVDVDPGGIATAAANGGSIGIAYTYNEPLIGFEFIKECAPMVKKRGLVNVLVTNGYINPEPAAEILPLIDAVNIDIKSIDDDFYRKHCGGRLDPVLDFAVQSVKSGCHVEVTNLVIPGLNDTDANFLSLAGWVSENMGGDVPLHLSSYHPQYKMDISDTPVDVLVRARSICRGKLKNVYLGNVPARFL